MELLGALQSSQENLLCRQQYAQKSLEKNSHAQALQDLKHNRFFSSFQLCGLMIGIPFPYTWKIIMKLNAHLLI